MSTKGLRVAGVPIGDDAWVTKFVDEKVEAVILDVAKIDDVLTNGIIHSNDSILPEHASWFPCA